VFDFQNLKVYQKAREINKEINEYIKRNHILDPFLKNQLRQASIQIVINIAEGSGKDCKKDKARYYSISRESVYECVSLIELLYDEGSLAEKRFKVLLERYAELSKMLYGLIRSVNASI